VSPVFVSTGGLMCCQFHCVVPLSLPLLLHTAGDGELTVDSLLWPFPTAITASCLWYDDGVDEPEGADGYLLGITWNSWQASQSEAPEGLQARLTSYVVSMPGPAAQVAVLALKHPVAGAHSQP